MDKTAAHDPQQLRVLIVEGQPTNQGCLALLVQDSWPFEAPPQLDYASGVSEAVGLLLQRCYALVVIEAGIAAASENRLLQVLRQRDQRVPLVLVSRQDRQVCPLDPARWAGAYLDQGQLNAISLQRAIAHSLALVSRLPSPPPPWVSVHGSQNRLARPLQASL